MMYVFLGVNVRRCLLFILALYIAGHFVDETGKAVVLVLIIAVISLAIFAACEQAEVFKPESKWSEMVEALQVLGILEYTVDPSGGLLIVAFKGRRLEPAISTNQLANLSKTPKLLPFSRCVSHEWNKAMS